MTEKINVITPHTVTICKGAEVKEVMLFLAEFEKALYRPL